ncbi:hypothetical protein [Paenibacillus polymyxa]|uniref:hypothetical protein n=1 Tax=Paenibacillus polymyxa TaxID=1406 RepID=UPI002AB3B53E|nr:hypothetical protein [Paenibacillus polymyxa]MDY8023387.1 hypothetical protein [Paenibacillus polymyxa]
MAARKKAIDEQTSVTVTSNFDGELVYSCPKSGERFLFSEIGDTDTMTIAQLRTMASQHKRFFEDGWIKIDDEEVSEFLKLEKFTKNILNKEHFKELFNEKPEKIEEILLGLTNEASKFNAFTYAQDQYVNGLLRDHFVIKAIEKGLGKQLDPNS